ncbi:MAG TPA: pyruvate ferredoxin oxidoreductase [bacterium]|nr:pyruvate ferredoxin oxidoreductase [bacterium]
MKEVLMGDFAVARAVQLARVEVISAYPITPQTLIVEELSEICGRGDLDAKFIKVESEHSALACCMGASMAGARTFTATASQGLLLMHEIMHWSAGARTPIVMANVNRAIAPPWNLWSDQTDSLAQRDTSWLQFYCENNQEVLDTVIQSFKIAEHLLLPTMLVLDAFILSHTSEVVDVPDQELVDRFLPPFRPDIKLDTSDPRAFGSITGAEDYQKLKQMRHEDMIGSIDYIKNIDNEYEELFGRNYGVVEPYKCDDAEIILVTSGTLSGTSRNAIDMLRDSGIAAGSLKIRLFRPFPIEDIIAATGDCKKIISIDRNMSVGVGGIFTQEIKAGLYGHEYSPEIYEVIGGLGGGDFTPENTAGIIRRGLEGKLDSSKINWEEL